MRETALNNLTLLPAAQVWLPSLSPSPVSWESAGTNGMWQKESCAVSRPGIFISYLRAPVLKILAQRKPAPH